MVPDAFGSLFNSQIIENRIIVSSALVRISRVVNQVATAFCVGCVVAMLGISVIGAFYMVITGDALSWTYSLSRLFIPWLGLRSEERRVGEEDGARSAARR